MNAFHKFLIAGAVCLISLAAQAQSFPTRAITIVNPYSAGGSADHVARNLAHELSAELGQQVVVEYKTGGGGGIAADYVARAQPDGHMLLLANNSTQVMAPVLTSVTYDGIKDFQFLGMAASVGNLLVVHPSVKAHSLQELIALAKANPGKLNYASSGIGGSPHLAAELLKYRAKIDLVNIPYKGVAPVIPDLLSGVVQLGIFNVSALLQFVKADKLRALAYASKTRSKQLPDVPTFHEAGLPNFEASSWYAIAAPKALPRPIAERLAKAIAVVLAKPAFRAAIDSQGAEVWPLTPEQTTAFVQQDAQATLDLLKAANLKLK